MSDVINEYAKGKRSGMLWKEINAAPYGVKEPFISAELPNHDFTVTATPLSPPPEPKLTKQLDKEDWQYFHTVCNDLSVDIKRLRLYLYLAIGIILTTLALAFYIVKEKPSWAIQSILKANTYTEQALSMFFSAPLQLGEERSIVIESSCNGEAKQITYSSNEKNPPKEKQWKNQKSKSSDLMKL